jgi:hypothetical protein
MPSKQTQATKYIGDLLKGRRYKIEPGIVLIGGDEAWQVFEYGKRCIGIDPTSNIWVGPSGGEWRPLGACTVSNALCAIEYLTKQYL